MTNIILLVKDRPRLTEQTLRTLCMHTDRAAYNVTVVDDGSWPETSKIISRYEGYSNLQIVTFLHSVGIVGFLKNVGVWASERFFGRGDWLCTIDNDIAFTPGWLDKMEHTLKFRDRVGQPLKLLGGYQHPFHKTNVKWSGVNLTDAVAGYMHFMRWSTWDSFGPYDQHAKGVCQSEDFAFCQKITHDQESYVGYINPPVIHNCGITNSEGKPAVGADLFPRIPGLVYE